MRAAVDMLRKYERMSLEERALTRQLIDTLDAHERARASADRQLPGDAHDERRASRSSSAERMRRHRERHRERHVERHIERHSDASLGVTSVTCDASHPSHVTSQSVTSSVTERHIERHSDASHPSHVTPSVTPHADAHTPSRAPASEKEINSLSDLSPLSGFSKEKPSLPSLPSLDEGAQARDGAGQSAMPIAAAQSAPEAARGDGVVPMPPHGEAGPPAGTVGAAVPSYEDYHLGPLVWWGRYRELPAPDYVHADHRAWTARRRREREEREREERDAARRAS